MSVIVLDKIAIGNLTAAGTTVAASVVDPDLSLLLGELARQDYSLLNTENDLGTTELLVMTQEGVAKKVTLKQLVDTILYFHDKQQLNHKNILNNIGNKPFGVPLLNINGVLESEYLPIITTDSSRIRYGISLPPDGKVNDYFLITSTGKMYHWNENSIPGFEWEVITNLKGETGDAGATGTTGLRGFTGDTGAQGTMILSGIIPPINDDGRNGDFYVDTVTGYFYGPKYNDEWNLSSYIIIKGTKGDTGNTGATGPVSTTPGPMGKSIISSTGVPEDTVGVDGEMFLDVIDYIIYGPKANGIWPLPGTSLKANILVQPSIPINPTQNTIWIDTSNL